MSVLNLPDAVIADIFSAAALDAPREACGLLVRNAGEVQFWPCCNVASAADEFEISAADFARAEEAGEVLAIVHSHPGQSRIVPSAADWIGCQDSGLTWLIVGDNGAMRWIDPLPPDLPLLGREFRYGVTDCYTLIRDYYQRSYEINLPDFERPAEGWWQDANGPDCYMAQFADSGFVDIGPTLSLKEGDLIFMRIKARQVNHAGVYLGNGLMLHHLHNQLSREEIYAQAWQHMTVTCVRHRSLA